MQVRGGLSGQDPSVRAKVEEHNTERKERARAKQLRRNEEAALAARRAYVLGRLSAIYESFNHLPTLSRYSNLLSVTLRSRHSPSTVDRSPKPSLAEARRYFFHALAAFLSRVHKPHYEAFLTLTEAYAQAQSHAERQALAKQILDRFLAADSFERLNFDPAQVLLRYPTFDKAISPSHLPIPSLIFMWMCPLARAGVFDQGAVSRGPGCGRPEA